MLQEHGEYLTQRGATATPRGGGAQILRSARHRRSTGDPPKRAEKARTRLGISGPIIGIPCPPATTCGSSSARTATDPFATRQLQVAYQGGPETLPPTCKQAPHGVESYGHQSVAGDQDPVAPTEERDVPRRVARGGNRLPVGETGKLATRIQRPGHIFEAGSREHGLGPLRSHHLEPRQNDPAIQGVGIRVESRDPSRDERQLAGMHPDRAIPRLRQFAGRARVIRVVVSKEDRRRRRVLSEQGPRGFLVSGDSGPPRRRLSRPTTGPTVRSRR